MFILLYFSLYFEQHQHISMFFNLCNCELLVIFLHIACVWFRLHWIECVTRSLEKGKKMRHRKQQKDEKGRSSFFSTVQWIFDGFYNAFCSVILQLGDCEPYTERPLTANITNSLKYMRRKKKTLFHAFVHIDWCCVCVCVHFYWSDTIPFQLY